MRGSYGPVVTIVPTSLCSAFLQWHQDSYNHHKTQNLPFTSWVIKYILSVTCLDFLSVLILLGRGLSAAGAPAPGGAQRPVRALLFSILTDLYLISGSLYSNFILYLSSEYPPSCRSYQYDSSVPSPSPLSPWSTQAHSRGASRSPSAHPWHPSRSSETYTKCSGKTYWPASRLG